MQIEPIRCEWCQGSELYRAYHDQEWGVPVFDDQVLFEFLILEGAQAGLSWITILQKREGYREAFENFDLLKLAAMTDQRMIDLHSNPAIVRNKLKIKSVKTNAQAFLLVQEEFGSFSDYFWGFTEGKVIDNRPVTMADITATTALSDKISKDLKKREFKFIGSTIVYAYMQAVGMVNDHLLNCNARK